MLLVEKIQTITDVVCPFCGTLCDDLEVDIDMKTNTVIEVRNGCQIGTKKFFASNPSEHRYTKPLIKENGSFKEVKGHQPIVGCALLVGSITARSYSDQDYWLTTPITEIIPLLGFELRA